MNSAVGICDTNIVYMKKLAEYFMQKSDIPLQIMTFSEIHQLVQYLKKDNLDILITGGEMCRKNLDSLSDTDTSINSGLQQKGVSNHVKWKIELVDSIIETVPFGENGFKISRYGSSAKLLQLIERLIPYDEESGAAYRPYIQEGGYDSGYSEKVFYPKNKIWSQKKYDSKSEEYGYIEKEHEYLEKKNGYLSNKNEGLKNVIAIYSPVNRCGKTSLSVLLTEFLGRKEHSMMISMDHCSEFSDCESNLSELIYYMSRKNDLKTEEKAIQDFFDYKKFVKTWQGVSYIASPCSAVDLAQISAQQVCKLIELLEKSNEYQYIVIDLPERMEGIQFIFRCCHMIIMPILDDCISRRKLEVFEKNMDSIVDSEEWILLSKKIHKIRLPETIEADNADNYYKELVWSDFGNYVREIMEQFVI